MNTTKENRQQQKNPANWPVSKRPFFQPKLTLNQPNDIYEQEADHMADKVMRMYDASAPWEGFFKPAPVSIRRKCHDCEEEEKPIHRKENGDGEAKGRNELDNYVSSLSSSGQSMAEHSRTFFESRFGRDFSGVRLHTDSAAAKSADSINALAYTTGNDIIFNSGQYTPDTDSGKKLIAHELTHVLQQNSGLQTSAIQRYPSCTSAQDTSIAKDHANALDMLRIAIDKISSYNGTTPAEVNKALAKHFNGSTSNAFATWININLRALRRNMTESYECFTGGAIESAWACKGTSTLATSFWCVPGFNIRLCPPYFGQSQINRSKTLIHEWVHKYGCNFDFGYKHDEGYSSNSTLTQLLNADSFANLVKDVQ